MMPGLTVPLLDRACRTFFRLAYPEGEHTIPLAKRAYLALDTGQELTELLRPPVCQLLPAPGGGVRGYAFRLGSAQYPHLKLQVTNQEDGTCVFAVDTHDSVGIEPGYPDAARRFELIQANRRLKQEIERAWEAEELLTFNALLRQALQSPANPPRSRR